MTTKSHCIANAVVAFALTARPEVAVAAMLTATLPDQLEWFLPLGRHRGASHWLLLWLAGIVAVPWYAREALVRQLSPGWSQFLHGCPEVHLLLGTCLFGLALGPFLHVLLDGCSDSGVPVAPFSRWQLKLGIYRTYSHRWRWDVSEWLFLVGLIVVCAVFWRVHG